MPAVQQNYKIIDILGRQNKIITQFIIKVNAINFENYADYNKISSPELHHAYYF
jgi:hypothetical protein